jgi:uncharacterized protein
MIDRHLEPLVLDSLQEFPVVLVTGARQVGKSTLVRSLCDTKWKAPYRTLDDRTVLDAVLTDPDQFITANPGPVAIDEVQQAPDVLRAIKLSVDRNRKPGQFLLTGSANILTMKGVSETLAGRMALHELHPFSYAELRSKSSSRILNQLFESWDFLREMSAKKKDTTCETLLEGIVKGGYPDPALMTKDTQRIKWFEAYRKTYIEQDVRNLQGIERVPEFSRLMLLAAARTGQVLNFADLGRDAGLPYVTLRRYMQILEQTYQIRLVPPYYTNLSKRASKAPKLYWTDTGMAAHLLDIHDTDSLQRHTRLGSLYETWVAGELQKLIDSSPQPMRLYGWRLSGGQEIDFLLEKGERLVAIEVKSGRAINPTVRKNFQSLMEQLGSRCLGGIVLYGGENVVPLEPKLIAVPYGLFFGS